MHLYLGRVQGVRLQPLQPMQGVRVRVRVRLKGAGLGLELGSIEAVRVRVNQRG